MYYFWALLLLFRLVQYLWAKRKGAKAPPQTRRGRIEPDPALLFYIFLVYPLCVLAAFQVGDALHLLRYLDPVATADLVPLVVFFAVFTATVLPHWLAWRVCGPRRLSPLGRFLLAVALHQRAGDRKGSRELHRARFDRDRDGSLAVASPWTTAAAALSADALGDPERADLLLAALRRLPPKTRLPRRALAIAAEGLAVAAGRRGDWERAAARAAQGKGRGIWFLRRVAAAHLERPVSKPLLRATWALAPGRVAALPLLQSALVAAQSAAPAGEAQAPPEADPVFAAGEAGPHLAHLHLLARAAAGQPVAVADVEALARAWHSELTAANAAGLVKRGLELGGQELGDLQAGLARTIVAEIEILAEVAAGVWSEGDGALAGRLARRRLDAAFAPVQAEVAALLRAEPGRPSRLMASPLEELERWLAFRAGVENLERIGGESALATAWHNGLRLAACNWPVYLSRERGADAVWATYLMHRWSADLATRVGDEEIAALSARNAAGVAGHVR